MCPVWEVLCSQGPAEEPVHSSHLLTGPRDDKEATGASFAGKEAKALTLRTCSHLQGSQGGCHSAIWVLGSEQYRGGFPSQLTGMTQQVSDLTSLQMCVAGTSPGSTGYTSNSLTFQSGGTIPRLKQLRGKKTPLLPGVFWAYRSVFRGHNPIHNKVAREQTTRSENCCYGPSPGSGICAVLERRIKPAVSTVQLSMAVCLQTRQNSVPFQHCHSSLENSPGKKK